MDTPETLTAPTTPETASALPRGVTVFIDGWNAPWGCYFLLYKDGHLLTVQAPPVYTPPRFSDYRLPKPSDDQSNHLTDLDFVDKDEDVDRDVGWGDSEEGRQACLKAYKFTLEKLLTVLSTVDITRSTWSYFVTRRDGSYDIVYKPSPLKGISCSIWAPLVNERDIIITQWITANHRKGLWDGKEVELLMGWEECTLNTVEMATEAHRKILGLDLSFEFLGHVLSSSNRVIGLITSTSRGSRPIQVTDRALVYSAISTIQQRNLFCRPSLGGILIHNGKVRFLPGEVSIRDLPRGRYGQWKAEIYHWECLDEMFKELEEHGNRFAPLDVWGTCTRIMVPTPAPSTPLRDPMELFARLEYFFKTDYFKIGMSQMDETLRRVAKWWARQGDEEYETGPSSVSCLQIARQSDKRKERKRERCPKEYDYKRRTKGIEVSRRQLINSLQLDH